MTEPSTVPLPFTPPAPVAALVREGVLDAELAALLSLLVEGGIPLVVGGGVAADRQGVRDALLSLLGPSRPVVRLRGAEEEFGWMPQAGELGWRSSASPATRMPGAVMVAELAADDDRATWGEAAHLAIRALTAGYSLLATTDARRLEDVLGQLSSAPVSTNDDELARLGVVLLLAEQGGAAAVAPRVVAAHYLRPVARDPGGHVQRLPPAVLATWNEPQARYDHFAWGVTAELAARTGRRPIDFEREQARRTASIARAAAGA